MYSSPDEMRAAYGEAVLVQLADAEAWNDAAIATVASALADASAIADGWVARMYGPASGRPVPDLVKLCVREMAFAALHRSPTDDVRKRGEAAEKRLEKIGKGEMKIDGGDIDALPAREGAILVEDPGRTFSRQTLAGF
ncbi:DUF1320 domain-containing protein [Sphingomonas canadensis]|uniref:DUF1320 domain-containing protein n=1 Tax=Sphingomonas canadensis TaxID=1219257 RepID=A0ABW3HAE7_9SPHN|nr:DUF1320 domain-containing protein [Sphingomonas canadensis]MCW3835974.1 DUF1320 domain-containing protein [Sphingomonas canadensis]